LDQVATLAFHLVWYGSLLFGGERIYIVLRFRGFLVATAPAVKGLVSMSSSSTASSRSTRKGLSRLATRLLVTLSPVVGCGPA
jgi:hypothetical protein